MARCIWPVWKVSCLQAELYSRQPAATIIRYSRRRQAYEKAQYGA